jgi:hypothetical protein
LRWSNRSASRAVCSLSQPPRRAASSAQSFDDWLAEDEREFTPAAFKRAIKLQSIHVDGDGGFEFWDDGSLFGNHAIHIHGTLQDGLTEIDVG